MKLRRYFVVPVVMGLVACSSLNVHPDPAKNTPANFKLDMKDCALSYPETPDGVYLKQRIDCMKLKGWQ